MGKQPQIFDQFGRPAKRSAFMAPGGFRAADRSIDRQAILATLRDSSEEITRFTRNTVDRKARFLAKNVGMVRGVKLDFLKYVIGPGIFPFSDSGDPATDERYDEYFREWARIADSGNRMTYWDMQRAAVGNQFVSGDAFRALVRSPNGFPQVKFIRPHNCVSDEKDENFVDGVRLGDRGQPTGYKFQNRDGTFSVLLPRNVVHSMIVEHGDEVRQISALHSAVLHIQDSLEILDYEKGAVKDHSRISRVIEKEYAGSEDEDIHGEDPLAGATQGDPGGPDDTVPLERIVGSEVHRLRTGEKMSSFKSERPSQTFSGFLDFLGREIFASTGWRYEFSWDPSSIGSASVRQVLDSIKRTINVWQEAEIRATDRIRNFVIASGIRRGDLPRVRNWWRVRSLPGAPDPTIDKGRDGKLDIMLVNAGMETLRNYYGRRGRHWKEETKQIAREQAFLRELNIDTNTAVAGRDPENSGTSVSDQQLRETMSDVLDERNL
jgi:capsid protein